MFALRMELSEVWRGGLFTVGSVGRVSVRFHGITLLGLFVLPFGAFAQGLVLGLLLIIIVHELGHAAIAKLVGAQVTGLDLSPVLGFCHISGGISPARRALVAWGGVLAQAVLLTLAVVVDSLLFDAHLAEGAPMLDALWVMFILINPMIMFTNLVPVDPLDGAQAWSLFPLLARPLRSRWASWRLQRFERQLPRAPRPRKHN